jgi:hypothetical protein
MIVQQKSLQIGPRRFHLQKDAERLENWTLSASSWGLPKSKISLNGCRKEQEKKSFGHGIEIKFQSKKEHISHEIS